LLEHQEDLYFWSALPTLTTANQPSHR